MKKNRAQKLLYIRAYCSVCGKLLHTSIPLTKSELMSVWDKAVLDAAGIPCKDCNHTIPNFYINLKIYHAGLKKELDPAKVLPTPKKSIF